MKPARNRLNALNGSINERDSRDSKSSHNSAPEPYLFSGYTVPVSGSVWCTWSSTVATWSQLKSHIIIIFSIRLALIVIIWLAGQHKDTLDSPFPSAKAFFWLLRQVKLWLLHLWKTVSWKRQGFNFRSGLQSTMLHRIQVVPLPGQQQDLCGEVIELLLSNLRGFCRRSVERIWRMSKNCHLNRSCSFARRGLWRIRCLTLRVSNRLWM